MGAHVHGRTRQQGARHNPSQTASPQWSPSRPMLAPPWWPVGGGARNLVATPPLRLYVSPGPILVTPPHDSEVTRSWAAVGVQTGRQADRQTDTATDRQTDRQTDTLHTNTRQAGKHKAPSAQTSTGRYTLHAYTCIHIPNEEINICTWHMALSTWHSLDW